MSLEQVWKNVQTQGYEWSHFEGWVAGYLACCEDIAMSDWLTEEIGESVLCKVKELDKEFGKLKALRGEE